MTLAEAPWVVDEEEPHPLDEGFAPVRSRMERWVSELEASAAAAREESIVFYRERDGQRALKAYHTRDLQLQQAVA